MTSGVYKRTPEHCLAISERVITDEWRANLSDAKLGVSCSPERRAAIKKGQEDSGMYEDMRGGNDICDHHYIYDHSDLSKYTMKMTRSKHQRLHRLMQISGIKVPHINL